MNFRVGFGVDIHKLLRERDLFIGGVEIESDLGALGHSDADVLLHSICDALLGAANLGDIGTHFPDTDPQYKGIDSKILLKRTYEKVKNKGYRLGNIDASVLIESPKINPYIPQMKEIIANILEVDIDLISIKATRGEKLGFVGTREGIKAICSVLIHK